MHGEEPFAMIGGRRVHGKEYNHGKTNQDTPQRNTTRQKPRNNGQQIKMAQQRPETTHGKEKCTATPRKHPRQRKYTAHRHAGPTSTAQLTEPW
jgi:hypothetical protein